MKNSDILNLVNSGFLLTTSNTVSPSSAYRLLKARKEVSKVYEAIEERRKDLLKECELDTEASQSLLKRAESEEEKLTPEEKADLEAKLERFNTMYNECLAEEVTLDLKPVRFEDWHEFTKENEKIKTPTGQDFDFRLGNLEWELEGILWEAPED